MDLYKSQNMRIEKNYQKKLTSCGGTSNETVLRSTFVYVSIHGIMKNIPGPLSPPETRRPNLKMTALSYS